MRLLPFVFHRPRAKRPLASGVQGDCSHSAIHQASFAISWEANNCLPSSMNILGVGTPATHTTMVPNPPPQPTGAGVEGPIDPHHSITFNSAAVAALGLVRMMM